MKGHGVYDPGLYRDKEEVKRWLERDPIKIYKDRLIKENILTEKDFEEIKLKITQEVEESIEFAVKSDYLDFNDLYNLVWV
jgi:Pyruvate/2-oxoglutarate dehydrogenase complex, dehydrogenase (E1) component, eukaryotic type, alpha subunit